MHVCARLTRWPGLSNRPLTRVTRRVRIYTATATNTTSTTATSPVELVQAGYEDTQLRGIVNDSLFFIIPRSCVSS